ncbi:MAG: hypothetical protein ACT4RN_22580 [Pseudonocardia sp.]
MAEVDHRAHRSFGIAAVREIDVAAVTAAVTAAVAAAACRMLPLRRELDALRQRHRLGLTDDADRARYRRVRVALAVHVAALCFARFPAVGADAHSGPADPELAGSAPAA